MRGGFAGVVAVPAWGQFMRSATAGAKADWYETPGDVERVAICRLSGARATEACRHQGHVEFLHVADDARHGGSGLTAEGSDVYEDLFPIGAVPSAECPLHGGAANAIATSGSSVPPMGDAVLPQPSSMFVVPASQVPTIESQIVVERVVGADGVTRTVMRQRR